VLVHTLHSSWLFGTPEYSMAKLLIEGGRDPLQNVSLLKLLLMNVLCCNLKPSIDSWNLLLVNFLCRSFTMSASVPAAALSHCASSGGFTDKISVKGYQLQIYQSESAVRTSYNTRKRAAKRRRKNIDDAGTIPSEIFSQVFELTKKNMHDMYNRCRGWGWNDTKKMKEFRHPDARFAVVVEQKQQQKEDLEAESLEDNCKVLGFVHFRFEVDEDDDGEQLRQVYM
jgi:hypothetical protein